MRVAHMRLRVASGHSSRRSLHAYHQLAAMAFALRGSQGHAQLRYFTRNPFYSVSPCAFRVISSMFGLQPSSTCKCASGPQGTYIYMAIATSGTHAVRAVGGMSNVNTAAARPRPKQSNRVPWLQPTALGSGLGRGVRCHPRSRRYASDLNGSPVASTAAGSWS
jgi:hypothetical protein